MQEGHLTHTGRTRTVFPRPRAVMLTSADLQPQQLLYLSPQKHHSPKLPSSLPKHHPIPTDFNPGKGIHCSDFSKSQSKTPFLFKASLLHRYIQQATVSSLFFTKLPAGKTKLENSFPLSFLSFFGFSMKHTYIYIHTCKYSKN